MQTSPPPATPWYREPWPWILMAGPLVAMAGCVLTIYLALANFAEEPILEGGTRRGLVVERAPAQPQPRPAAGAAAAPAR